MAPPPEYDKEPKAPDKNLTNNSTDDSKVLYNHIKEHPTNPDHKAVTAGANDVVNDKYVETLDDGQLRALLDEAINYKCPKDREGKSSLFKNLLQEAEEQECEAATRDAGAGRGGRRGRGRREHHSSLQDLVAAIAGETAPRRGRAHGHAHAHAAPPAATVSARAHHGGSLPSGVDKSFLLSEEASRYEVAGAARGGYLATVRCVNPPPLAERRVSAGDANAPEPAPAPLEPPAPPPAAPTALAAPASDEARRRAPMFPMTYTARATLEIGSGSVCSGRAVTTTTASNQVDSAIPFSCITTPEVVTSCNTTSSTSTVAVDPKPRSVISSNFNGLPLVRPASTTFSNIDEYKKSLDENGNAVQGFNSPLSGSSQHKKPRRKKSSKNETIIKSQEIDGYQGNKDLNEVLRFIESHADGARAPSAKLRAAKKRSTERRKDKEPKLQRASSLEELSRTTLEELTAAPAPPKPERRSWGDAADADAAPAPHELTDFQTVTKKRKPRRRADDRDPRARARPSAPASDRSNDSNDDADSVTALPSLPPPPPPPPPPLPPPPAPPAPHASYADIARTRHNIPDLIESCNYCAAAPPVAGGGAGGGAGSGEARARKVAAGKRKEPDVVADRRPAVVLAAGARPRDMDGVTFGFDVNEQLLGGAGGGGCDLLREAGGAGAAAWAALRYVAPAPPPDTQHLHQIIDYVGAAWDDVVRCGGGKVRYFSE